MNILALIPARSGSKGLPNKNIRLLQGKPLLVRAIELAKQSMRSSEHWNIVVSTDSARYARIAQHAGAEVPALRPKQLAQDQTRLIDVVLHELYHHKDIDVVLLLSACCPLTRPSDVRRALRLFKKQPEQAVVSVMHAKQHPSWFFELRQTKLFQIVPGRVLPKNNCYVLNGALYLGTPNWLKRHHQFFVQGKTKAFIMPQTRSLDIETSEDLKFAQRLLAS